MEGETTIVSATKDVVMKEDNGLSAEENAEKLKAQGNDAFKVGDYQKAIKFYSEALGKSIGLFNLGFRVHKKRGDID